MFQFEKKTWNEELIFSVSVLTTESKYSFFFQQKLQTRLHMSVTLPFIPSYNQERSYYCWLILGFFLNLKKCSTLTKIMTGFHLLKHLCAGFELVLLGLIHPFILAQESTLLQFTFLLMCSYISFARISRFPMLIREIDLSSLIFSLFHSLFWYLESRGSLQ